MAGAKNNLNVIKMRDINLKIFSKYFLKVKKCRGEGK
jgi:hypothetical protein